MITLQDAYGIALSELHIPHDATLTYINLLSNRYVFEWKHSTDKISSENDRILIWIDPHNGNILLKDVVWKSLSFPSVGIQSVEVIYPQLDIIGYHEIAKPAYFTYDNSPLQDWYWVGEDAYTRYLIDEYGTIVGEMIPKPVGCSLSGHTNNTDNIGCWSTYFYANYFGNWTDTSIEQSCGTDITSAIYSEIVSDQNTMLYQCTAHGGSAGFRFHSGLYIYPSKITTMMKNRSPIPFAELCHCAAMVSTGSGTLSHAYRKGQTTNTITVGLKHTTDDSWIAYITTFRRTFYNNISNDKDSPIKDAYDDAIAFVPAMDGHYDFVGDTSMCLNDIIIKPSCAFGVT